MEWKDYLHDRLIAFHPAGFHVIRPRETSETQHPLFCPHCEAIMRSRYDDEAFKKYRCCDDCANKWVYQDPARWLAGWRPSTEEVQNKSAVSPI